eukprot:scpid80387/ scgid27976/ 
MAASIPVAQPIPVAYPVNVLRERARQEEAARLQRRGCVRHELKSGDTVQSLAMRYGVSAEEIRKENKLYSHDSLAARHVVIIPVDKVDETGVDRHLPYRDGAPRVGLDKSSVDSLFSSCDAQIQATRSVLHNYGPGRQAAAAAAESAAHQTRTEQQPEAPTPPYSVMAAAGTAASDLSSYPPPPSYDQCSFEETNIDGIGYSPGTARSRMEQAPMETVAL